MPAVEILCGWLLTRWAQYEDPRNHWRKLPETGVRAHRTDYGRQAVRELLGEDQNVIRAA